MKDEKNLHYHITRFLSTYITGERGLSAHTFDSYNYVIQQLTHYFYDVLGRPINKISMDEFNAENIKGFLKSVEDKGCSVATRNHRLAVIKAFCKYVQWESPMNLYNMQQILSIRAKKAAKPTIQYLTPEQLAILLDQPDRNYRQGFRDLLMLAVLSDTGARVTEFINIKIADVNLTRPAKIRVLGKGNKHRFVTVTSKTQKLLELYYEKENLHEPSRMNGYLFVNRSGKKLTRAGVTYIIQKYVDQAHEKFPAEFPAKLTPHCLRHTKAMNMLMAGQNLVYIRDALGHEHIKTTEVYARIGSKQQYEALEKAQAQIKTPDTTTIDYRNDPSTLSWLTKYCE